MYRDRVVNADSIPEQVADSFRSVVNDRFYGLRGCVVTSGMENSKRHARMLMSRMMGQCLLSSCFEEYVSNGLMLSACPSGTG